ncbi:MAG: hypothetical protein WB795_03720, partial [Candidatus Acidiferrales bacterium]
MFRRRCVIRLLSCAWTLIAFAPAAFAQSSSTASRLPVAATEPNSDAALGNLFLVSSSTFADSSIDAVADDDSKSSSNPDSNSDSGSDPGPSTPLPIGQVRPFPGLPETLPPLPDHFQISQDCAAGVLSGKDCKFHWWPALGEQLEDLTIETGWNLAQNHW